MRRRRPERRKILPDPAYGDLTVAKFVNNLMLDGKKSTAEKLFYKSLDIVKYKEKKDGLEVFKKALDNVSPIVEVKSKRIKSTPIIGKVESIEWEFNENSKTCYFYNIIFNTFKFI